jgi:hypothetical protein
MRVARRRIDVSDGVMAPTFSAISAGSKTPGRVEDCDHAGETTVGLALLR